MQFCPTGGCRLDQVTNQDRGLNGSLVMLTNETRPTVVSEVRDRGVAWLCKQVTSATARGQEFVVWGVVDGGNYDNIIQYGFRDDGTMTFRMGNTGYDAPPIPTEAHTHNALWRVDMDLNGFASDTASLVEHFEPSPTALQAQDVTSPFSGGIEGADQWNPVRFTSLLVEDPTLNAFGHKWGYEFTPAQLQTSRHFGFDDVWTGNDVFVTVYHQNELGWTTAFQPPDNYLLSQIANHEPVTNADLVEWVKTSAHHDPTDEDRSAVDVANKGGGTGVTLVHWSGFDVVPHNLFDANPMGGPSRCGQ
jgi:primary-amine oxidase